MERSKRTVDVPSRKVWPGMDQMISDYESLEKSIRDMRNVLAVIAYQQEDHILSVPVSALQALPKGSELEVSFDKDFGQYNFRVIMPNANQGSETPVPTGILSE